METKVRVFLYEGFLTDEECDHLVALEQGEKEALVRTSRDSGSVGKKILLPSSGSSRGTDDELLKRIQERISAWTMLPGENSRPLKITRYDPVKTKDKVDYIDNNNSKPPLMSTVVIFLSNVCQGGQLVFPYSDVCNLCVKGDMWVATKLLFSKTIASENVSSDTDGRECTDQDDNCPSWAAHGECQRNPVFMTVSRKYYAILKDYSKDR